MNDDDDILHLNLNEIKAVSALGRGAKGVVFLVELVCSGELLALKTVLKSNSNRNGGGGEEKRICFEQEVLRKLRHPLLPKLRAVLCTENVIGYGIDYCPGGDLNRLRKKQTEKMFSGDIIRFYAAELVLALDYLHKLGIVYRDLKPENVMIQENGHIMLVDFDLSTNLSPKPPRTPVPKIETKTTSAPKNIRKTRSLIPPLSMCCNSRVLQDESVHPADSARSSVRSTESVSKSNSFVGTEEYVSPEMIIGNGHDFATDWWCLGVVLYEMLYGTTPFKGANRKETFYRILNKEPDLVGETTPLRGLIGKLLDKDPRQRINVDGIKSHEYFRGVDWTAILTLARPPFVPFDDVRGSGDSNSNNGIEIESFVKGVFSVDEEKSLEKKISDVRDDDFLNF